MILNGTGGANTTTGALFEKNAELLLYFKANGYTTERIDAGNYKVSMNDKVVGHIVKKQGFYRYFKPFGVDWRTKFSSQILPDNGFYNIETNTVYVVECKYQRVHGSTDEKLQTCDFKKRQYTKLFSDTDVKVEYVFVLSDWYKLPKYKDVLEYIKEKECHYFFNEIPLEFFGLKGNE